MNLSQIEHEYGISFSELNYIFRVLFGKRVPYDAGSQQNVLTAQEQTRLFALLSQYRQEIPLGYLLGQEEFYGMPFYVDERVLVPRQETELLVEEVLQHMGRLPERALTVADICSGSGNIGITLLKECQRTRRPIRLYCSDLSSRTFAVLRKNAVSHGVKGYSLVHADALSAFKQNVFDVIVSNPPYVEDSYVAESTSLRYEPAIALKGGRQGLDIVKRIIEQSSVCLAEGGSLFMEINAQQAEAVRDYAVRFFKEDTCEVRNDYAGLPRVLKARK